MEADEDTDQEVGDDVGSRPEASSAAKPRRRTRAAVAKQSTTTAATKVGAAKTAKLEAEKKKRKRRVSPPPAIETPTIPTPSAREIEDEEVEATDDPPVVEDRTARRSLSRAAKRQREVTQKTTGDDLRQGMEAQRATAGAQARMPVLVKVRPFRPKLRAPATVR